MITIVHWESINSNLNPELKEMLFDGYIWKHTCPNCGQEINTNSSLLYHNPEKRYMIQFEPIIRTKNDLRKRADELTTEWKSMFKKTGNIVMQNIANNMKYRYRLVCMSNELIEKIKIFDAGYNDITIELLKEGYRMILEESEGKKGIHVYFDSIDEKSGMMNVIVRSLEYEQKRTFPAGPMYQIMDNIANKVDALDQDLYVKYIDNEFAVSVMEQFAEMNKKQDKKICPSCLKVVTPTFHGLCPDCDTDLEKIKYE